MKTKFVALSRPVLLGFVAIIAAGFLGALSALVAILGPVTVDTRDEAWNLPQPSEYEVPLAYEEVAQSQVWELDKRTIRRLRKEARKEEQPENSWKLLGLVAEGEDRHAVIQIKDSVEIAYLSVGDQLPTGEVITALTATSLAYESEDGPAELQLYKRN